MKKRNVGKNCSKLSERKQSPVGSAWLGHWDSSPFIASKLLKSSLESIAISALPILLLCPHQWDFSMASVTTWEELVQVRVGGIGHDIDRQQALEKSDQQS